MIGRLCRTSFGVGAVLIGTYAYGGEPVQDAETAAKLGSQSCSFPSAPKVEWSAKHTPKNDWVAWPGDATGPFCSKPIAFIRALDGQLVCDIARCVNGPPPAEPKQ